MSRPSASLIRLNAGMEEETAERSKGPGQLSARIVCYMKMSASSLEVIIRFRDKYTYPLDLIIGI